MISQNAYIFQQMQQNRVKRAYAQIMNIGIRIQTIARYIAAGGDPSQNPDIKDDYFYLVGEYGEDIFSEEVSRIKLEQKKENNG